MINRSELSHAEKLALDCLYEVIDPEIGLNIVDLGLVYGLTMEEKRKNIRVVMTLTTQFCPMGASIVGSVEETLKDYLPDHEVEVALVYEPRWNAHMISEEGRAFLG